MSSAMKVRAGKSRFARGWNACGSNCPCEPEGAWKRAGRGRMLAGARGQSFLPRSVGQTP